MLLLQGGFNWQPAHLISPLRVAAAGFAYKQFPGRSKEEYRTDPDAVPKDGLVFAGLISLVDPPKPGVPEAIAECRDAFIRVTMVTGERTLQQ